MRSEHITDTTELEQEILTMLEHLSQFQLLLLQEFVVQIELIAIITLHILPVAIHGTKIHVQQSGTTIDIEIARWNAVLGEFLRVVHFVISRGSDIDECLVKSYQLVYLLQQRGEFCI